MAKKQRKRDLSQFEIEVLESFPLFGDEKWQEFKNVFDQLSEGSASVSLELCKARSSDIINDPNYKLLIVIDRSKSDKIIATGTFSIHKTMRYGRTGWVEDIVVDRTYRRRGIADMIQDTFEKFERSFILPHTDLTSSKSIAQKYWEQRGYKKRDTNAYRRICAKNSAKK